MAPMSAVALPRLTTPTPLSAVRFGPRQLAHRHGGPRSATALLAPPGHYRTAGRDHRVDRGATEAHHRRSRYARPARARQGGSGHGHPRTSPAAPIRPRDRLSRAPSRPARAGSDRPLSRRLSGPSPFVGVPDQAHPVPGRLRFRPGLGPGGAAEVHSDAGGGEGEPRRGWGSCAGA